MANQKVGKSFVATDLAHTYPSLELRQCLRVGGAISNRREELWSVVVRSAAAAASAATICFGRRRQHPEDGGTAPTPSVVIGPMFTHEAFDSELAGPVPIVQPALRPKVAGGLRPPCEYCLGDGHRWWGAGRTTQVVFPYLSVLSFSPVFAEELREAFRE